MSFTVTTFHPTWSARTCHGTVTLYMDEGGKGHQLGLILSGIPNDTEFSVVIRGKYGHKYLPVYGWTSSVKDKIGMVTIPREAEKTKKQPYDLVLSGRVGEERRVYHVLRVHLKSKFPKKHRGSLAPMKPHVVTLVEHEGEDVVMAEEERQMILYGVNDDMGYPQEFHEGDVTEMMKWLIG